MKNKRKFIARSASRSTFASSIASKIIGRKAIPS